MSRKRKFGVCVVLALVALAVAVVVGFMVANPPVTYGANGETEVQPVTAAGWFQLGLSALATAGFTGGALWQALAGVLETYFPQIIKAMFPKASAKTVKALVDVTKLGTVQALIEKTNDPVTKAKYIDAARSDFDNLKDDLYPVEPSTNPAPAPAS